MKRIDTGQTRLIAIILLLLAAPASLRGAQSDGAAAASLVGGVLERLSGSSWHFKGTTRQGTDTEIISRWEASAGGRGFVGRGETLRAGETVTSSSLYIYHPRRGRWTYTSVSSSGVVQEAEELESSPTHFVFKGTAYRPDGTQTTFVWRVTLQGDEAYLSESMAFHGGDWQDNPPARFSRSQGPPAVSAGPVNGNTVDPPSPALSDLDWLVGSWYGEGLGGSFEEHWTPASGGTMLGTFRLVQENVVHVIEYLMISQEEERITMRFKHFRADYSTWEEDQPFEFTLLSVSDHEAVFHSDVPNQSSPRRITYRLTDAGDLRVIVAGSDSYGRLVDSFEILFTPERLR